MEELAIQIAAQLVPVIVQVISQQQASGQVVTEASVMAELRARGAFQADQVAAWMQAHHA